MLASVLAVELPQHCDTCSLSCQEASGSNQEAIFMLQTHAIQRHATSDFERSKSAAMESTSLHHVQHPREEMERASNRNSLGLGLGNERVPDRTDAAVSVNLIKIGSAVHAAHLHRDSQYTSSSSAVMDGTVTVLGVIGLIILVITICVVYFHLYDMQSSFDPNTAREESEHRPLETDRCGYFHALGKTVAGRKVPSRMTAFTLCESLVVPETKRLVCDIPNQVRSHKQDVQFNITSKASRGAMPLVRVQIMETAANLSIILLQQSKADDSIASASTAELHSGALNPVLNILRPSGTYYAACQKKGRDYVISRTSKTLLTFQGDFRNHNVNVLNSDNECISVVQQLSPASYQVQVEESVDASLVLMGLLCIDKCEAQAA